MSFIRDLQASVWDAECRHDIDGILALFHPDGTFYPTGDAPRRGHAAIREMTEDFLRDFPELEIDILGEWGDGELSAAIEFRARMKDVEGNRFELRGVNLVEVQNGKFVSVRAYEESPAPVTA